MRDITINAGNLTKTYGTAAPLVVQLLDGSTPVPNKPVIINIHGVDYTRTTNANGTTTLNINLEPGVYLTNITFEGDSTYNPTHKSVVVSVVTYTISEPVNNSKNNANYFEVNKIPFKVLTKDGFDSDTGVSITRTRLLHSNQFNNVPSHVFNQGNAGVSFEVSILILADDLYEGKSYREYLETWEKYQKVVDVVTNAFDVPNGK